MNDKRLSSFDFLEDDIMKVIQQLNPNKAHGQDNINIRKIFEECLRTGTFPLEWKKNHIVPVFEKQIYKNYRPVSLLLTFGKIL